LEKQFFVHAHSKGKIHEGTIKNLFIVVQKVYVQIALKPLIA